jgi:peptidoglycan hydrolase-like protein with peptidoglycan-binding domain
VAVVISLSAIILAALIGWIAGSRVSSPAEIAARTAPPEPTPIMASVESRVLSTNVVTRGTGRFGTPTELVLAPSILAAGDPIVTSVEPPGTPIEEGDVLMRLRGRPVVVLMGAEPMYRDLGPGISGRDVRQLQAALTRLGFDPGTIDGVFSDATAAAVEAWAESTGVQPVVATDFEISQIQPIEASLIEGGVLRGGVMVPADAVLFVPSLPIRIAEFLVSPGEIVDGPFASATDANVAIDSSVPIEEAGLINEGMTVRIDEPDLGIEATGEIARVADAPGTNELDGFHVYFEVLVDDAPPALINASVRLTVPVESTGEEVVVVPITALFLDADGSSSVQREVNGDFEVVKVVPGLSAQGFVQVQAVEGTLEVGDLVLVGYEQASAGGA